MKKLFFRKQKNNKDVWVRKHQKLVSSVCCPQCHGSLQYPDVDCFENIPFAGSIVCPQCGEVGWISNLKLSFNADERPVVSSDGKQYCGELSVQSMTLAPEQFTPADCWNINEGLFWSSHAKALFSLNCKAHAIALIFQKHPWAGIARILLDGVEVDSLDCFEEAGTMFFWYPMNLDGEKHLIQVEVTGEKNPLSNDAQIFLVGTESVEVVPGRVPAIRYNSRNDGNPYPGCFKQLIQDVDDDGLILDCGSGDRIHPDPRVINFEYSPFSAPDIFGDGHKLPFKENSFDLILSQAVIEHLYDPFTAVAEILRVLKPGGVVYAESAFMQPLHAVPYHFFNTTGWALENLFKEFQIVNVGHEGKLSDTVNWFYNLTALREKGFGDKLDAVLDIMKELDDHITAEELKYFSSFVTILAKKRVG